MKQVFFVSFFLLLLAGSLSLTARAEETANANLYQVVDVPADITADTAPHARDKAVLQAQRTAFGLLVTRFGGDAKLAEQQSDDTIATLVQAFEVQQEKTSAVHYIGTFTVQFKPTALRAFLNKHGVSYSEARARPVLVLPLVTTGAKTVLWEEPTKWRAALEEAAKGSSVIPLVVPPADAENANLLSVADATAGKADGFVALMKKYQASGLLVALLTGDADHPDATKPFEIAATPYDLSGKAGEAIHLTTALPIDRASTQKALTDSARNLRSQIEKTGQQAAKAKGPVARLPVTVPIETLVVWNEIKRKLDSIPAVQKTTVLSLTRGSAKIELEFRGEPTDLKDPLAIEGLSLENTENGWILQEARSVP